MAQFKDDDLIKTFLKVELPDLDAIETLDESFRQHVFAQWITHQEDKPRYKDLQKKLHKLIPKAGPSEKLDLNPTNYDLVKSTIGELITEVEYNKTQNIKIVVPEALRLALFDGWETKGINFIRILYHYCKLNQMF